MWLNDDSGEIIHHGMKRKQNATVMMKDAPTVIVCPYCKREIPLDQAITHQITEKLRKEFEDQAALREGELKAKEEALREQAKALRKAKEEQEKALAAAVEKLKSDYETRMAEEKKRLEEAARKKAESDLSTELAAMREDIEEKKQKLKEFAERELQLRKEKTKLEEDRQRLELDVQQKLDEERARIREETAKQIAEQHRLKDVEKDRHIEALKTQIDELQRKVEQGPGERGEALEWVLETTLREHFRHDIIEPVPRGMRGADVIQKVCTMSGQVCGTIIWESKRVKTWSDGWIEKLKEDQREAKADIAALASTVLPKGVSGITTMNGVWVTDYSLTVGLALALRYALLETASVRVGLEGRKEKLEMLFEYLSGSEFRQQIEGIVEAFVSMKRDLDAEKRAMEKIWAKREKQIEKVVKNTSRMYGSLQGIVGSTLPELKALELKALKEE